VTEERGRGAEHPASSEAAELASQQADPDRLMEGEDPTTVDLDDARHWHSVYQELFAFKRDLLDKLQTRLAEISSPDARDEAVADERLLGLELERFQQRAEFWRRRIQELS
jgi:hypothetical protein